jgi:tRNA A37 methylthiotransferase MiaB
MVTGSRTSGNRGVGLDDEAKKMIQSIKEVVDSHSDADIYTALKEANMDANEAVEKLIHQDPFHEVKRKRDRKKEVRLHITVMVSCSQFFSFLTFLPMQPHCSFFV